jgi:hypothetical protein
MTIVESGRPLPGKDSQAATSFLELKVRAVDRGRNNDPRRLGNKMTTKPKQTCFKMELIYIHL